MENSRKFIGLSIVIILNVLRTILSAAVIEIDKQESLIHIADSYLDGWSEFSLHDDNLSPFLSKLVIDSRTGKIYADKSVYCELKNLLKLIKVHSLKRTFFRRKIRLIRSVSLLNHDLNCTDSNLSDKTPLQDDLTVLLLPNNIVFHQTAIDVRAWLLKTPRAGNQFNFTMKFDGCQESPSTAGSVIHVDWKFMKMVKKCGMDAPAVLKIQANDKGRPLEEKRVLVLSGNDNNRGLAKQQRRSRRSVDPYFPRSIYRVSIKEDVPVGTTIITINLEPNTAPDIRYAISPSSVGFDMDPKSGAVTVNKNLDYETMGTRKYYRLFVRTLYDTTQLQINIQDVNDNPPIFEQKSYERTVPEDIPNSASILEVKATDEDSGLNRKVTYSIKNSGGVNSAFEIDSYSGQIFLRIASLDRETTPRYQLTILAEDEGTPKKSSEVKAVIIVSDINDNSPVFAKPEYQYTMSENTAPETVLLTVTAEDKDEGTNSKLSYRIYNDYTNPVVSKFAIGRTSGEIVLKQKLDYEEVLERSVRFTVEANDAGLPARKGTTFVNINVQDYNDNKPIFRRGCIEYVLESVAKGSVVCTVSASDRDASPPNNEVVYTLGQAPTNLPFEVEPTTGHVKVSGKLDYDDPSKRKFEFTIIATDKGVPSASTSIIARITLKNDNDNYPVFSKPHYSVSIPETTRPSTSILELSATDIDQPHSREFQFAIIKGNTKNCFSISYGKIYVQCRLNYDTDKVFNLTVEVKDSGALGPSLSSQTYVLIKIIDANTHSPVFLPVSNAKISEDAKVGSLVLNITARDQDTGENGRISYSIVNPDGFFKIHSTTGAVRTLKKLDAETNRKHDLTVMARDHGIPFKKSVMQVVIAVDDVNDNAPIFKGVRPTWEVLEDVKVGTAILQVKATDRDEGSNNRKVHYALAPNHDGNGTFSIKTDGPKGIVRNLKKLDRETVASYDLVIIAMDSGTPQLKSQVKVKILVEDVRDSPPIFQKRRYYRVIPENFPSQTPILTVKATSADLDSDKEIAYVINRGTGGSDFRIGTSSGSISLKSGRKFDYEKQKRYQFDVVAYYGPMALTNSTVVVIELTDVNDNAPTLQPFEIFLNFFEDKYPKDFAFQIPGEDRDANSTLTYELLGGTGKTYVTVDPATGKLTFNPNIVNPRSELKVDIRVSDGKFEAISFGTITAATNTSDIIRIELYNMTNSTFLNSTVTRLFKDSFAAAVGCNRRLVFIVGVKTVVPHLETDKTPRAQISVAAKNRTGGQFLTPKYMKDRLYLNREIFVKRMGKVLATFDDAEEIWCSAETCSDYQQCEMHVRYKQVKFPHLQKTKTVFLLGLKPQIRPTCKCPPGFKDLIQHGRKRPCAASYNLCFSNPCGANGVCISTDRSFACKCKNGYVGRTCKISMLQPSCPPNSAVICNKGLCRVDGVHGGLTCDCPAKGKEYTPRCELTTRYFPAKAYTAFTGLTNRWKLHLSMEFSTESVNAVLFYNGRYSEKKDFVAIRINGGQAELVFSLGKDTIVVRSYVDGGVNSGSWQKVTITFDNQIGRIAVGEDCDVEMGGKANEGVSMKNCAASKVSHGTFRSLDLTAPFFIGGYPSGSTMRIPNHDFIGCIRNLYIDHVFVDLANTLRQKGSVAGCPVKKDLCAQSKCVNGGICVNLISGFRCDCKDGFAGKLCEINVNANSGPVRFTKDSIMTFKNNTNFTVNAPPASFTTEMTIRTRQTDAVLIHEQIAGRNAYLKIASGSLSFYYQASEMANLSTAFISDGKWHHVKVKLDSKRIQLSQDYERHHVTKIHQVNMDSKPVKVLSVGGIKQGQKASQGFLGCLQGLLFDGDYIKTVGTNLQPGCQSTKKCENCGPGTCSKEWDAETCNCPKGFTGPNCIDVCHLNPCLNQGFCKRSSSTVHGFTCSCKPSFTGPRCETKMSTECDDGYFRLPGKWECGPCECDITRSFDPTCNKTSGQCFCKSRYYFKNQRCEKCNCLPEGSLDSGKDCDRLTGQCRCNPHVIGLNCDRCIGPFEAITRNCQEINTSCPKSYSERIWWTQITLGRTRIEDCPTGTVGNAKRYCHPKKSWQKADLSACTSLEFLFANTTLYELNNKKKNMTRAIAIKLASSLEYALTTVRTLYEKDIRIGYDAISKIVEYEGSQERYGLASSSDGKFIKNIMISTSSLMGLDSKSIWAAIQQGGAGSAGLMRKMEKLLTILAENFAYVRRQRRSVTTLPPYNLASKNILMEIQQINTDDALSYHFPMQRTTWTNEYATWKNSKASVVIPPTIFNNTHLSNKEASIGLLLYKTLGDLLPSIFEEKGTKRRYKVTVYSDVLTLTIPGLSNQTLADNITFYFRNKKNNRSAGLSCVSWNYSSTSSRSGGWSTVGCITIPNDDNTIECHCNHLTSFAVVRFVDLLPPKMSAFRVEPLTYITVAVSMAFLLFTFLTYVCLSQLRSNANSIHKNLCAALCLAELVFIVGINRTSDATVCRIIAILLHYFFSCVFSWMLVEAFHMYRMLTEKRNVNYEEMTFYYFIGWGAPVIVVGVTAGLVPQGYGNKQFCWVSTGGDLLWTFTAPIMAMVAANFLIFLIACVTSLKRSYSAKEAKHKSRLRFGIATSMFLLPMLCGTFVVGLLSVNVKMQTFNLMFSAFVIIQGLYIVTFYVIFNREVRAEYKNAYIRWKTGDKSYGKKRPRVKRTLLVDSSYREQFAHLTATFNLSTSTTDSSTDGGRVFSKRRKGERDLASSTQPDSSDTSDEETSKDPDTVPSDSSETSEDEMPMPKPKNSQKNVNGGGVASPNSTRSSNSNSKSSSGSKSPNGGKAASGGAKSPPMNAARTPDFKVANQKKLRTAPLYASDGPMHSTPSDNSDNSEKRSKRWQGDDDNPDLDVTDVTVMNEEMDGPEDPLLASLKRQRAEQSSSSDTSEVSSLPSVIRLGPGGKPQSILKKKSKYGNVTDSDSERRGKVRVRISDKSKKPLVNLNRDQSEFQDSQV